MIKKIVPILLIISVLIISGCSTGSGNTTVTNEVNIKTSVGAEITSYCKSNGSPPPCPSGEVAVTGKPSPTSDVVSSGKPSPTKTSDTYSTTGCTAEEAALLNCKYGCFLLQPETPQNYYGAFTSDKPVPMCKQICKEVRAIPGVENQGLDYTPNDEDVGNDVTPGVYISADGSFWDMPNSYNKEYAATGKSQDSGRIDDDDNSYATKYFCHEYKDKTGEPGLYTTVKGELPCKKYTDSNGELRPEIPYTGLCCKADDKDKNTCYDPFEGLDETRLAKADYVEAHDGASNWVPLGPGGFPT